MKTKLLLTGMLSATLLLGACGTEEKSESNDKKSESVEKKKEASKKSESKKDTDKKDNESTEQTEPATAIIPAHQEEEKDSEGLTQKDRDRIATEQAKEYGENNPEGEQSNEGKMGPGPDDPNYKPDPKFTDPGEGYDPVEGNKMPSADSYEFKQEPTEQSLQGDLPADLNESEEQNTNMNGEHVVAPGYKNQEEQSQAYEEYKKGKEAQAQAGPSAVPGAGMMDLSDFE